MYVACACRLIFHSGSLDIVGGDASLTSYDNTSYQYSSGSIRRFCLHPNIRDKYCKTKSEVKIFSNQEYQLYEISNVLWSVRKPYLRASYHVYKIDYLLVRDISLPAMQFFVIAIENILRECVCNLTSQSNKNANVHMGLAVDVGQKQNYKLFQALAPATTSTTNRNLLKNN